MTRKDWQFLRTTEAIAREFSTCAKRQYAALIVDTNHRVRGWGYNGGASGEPHCLDGHCPRLHEQRASGSTYETCIAAHAEANAITNSDYADRIGATLYVNGPPCWGCATHILTARLARVVCYADPSYHQWPVIRARLERGGVVVEEVAGHQGQAFNFAAHLEAQAAWSLATFGPGARTAGVVAHIRKELAEIEAAPLDLEEWIDVMILACDGAWRTGAAPAEIIACLAQKMAKNRARRWPDWRTMAEDAPIEHVREEV